MKDPRNPFKLRASENIVPEPTFLRLFAPKVLDLIDDEAWGKVQIFQSAPGGGKTSLFRVFTPSSLQTLHRLKQRDDCKDLYKKLEALGAIGDEGPKLLGVMLSCSQGYSMIEELGIEPVQRMQLFYSLLNVRIILAALRGIALLGNLDENRDLADLAIQEDRSRTVISSPPQLPKIGTELLKWAVENEEAVCEAIDSFDPMLRENLKGHSSLFALQLLQPRNISLKGKGIFDQVVVMLDDVHKLSARQRTGLVDNVLNGRWPVTIWIAERLEALTSSEMLALGATSGRDYEPKKLEKYWANKGKQFEGTISNIADKRVRLAANTEIDTFASCLGEGNETEEDESSFVEAFNRISQRVVTDYGKDPRYTKWLQSIDTETGSIRDQAIAWRSLEIIIQRKIRETQMTLPFAYSVEEMEKSATSQVQSVAEISISNEFDIPYYFGFSTISALSSTNIEQFLDFASELFEQIIASELLNKGSVLSPRDQQGIVTKVAERRWKEIPRRVPNGAGVQKLLSAIQEFGFSETNRPNAPYGPVTGIGLSVEDQERLVRASSNDAPKISQLASVLSDCIANNLLEPRSIIQGQKNETKLVLYMNRWICIRAGLPLQYGGWRHVTPEQLVEWMEKGFRSPRNMD